MYRILISTPRPEIGHCLSRMARTLDGVRVFGPVIDEDSLFQGVGDGGVDLVIMEWRPPYTREGLIRELLSQSPSTEIILVKTAREAHGPAMVRAMEQGAWEWLDGRELPSEKQESQIRHRLIAQVGLLRSRKLLHAPPQEKGHSRFFIPPRFTSRTIHSFGNFHARVLALAASTGGPEILGRILSLLPSTLKTPVMVVQHMPRGMDLHFAQVLGKQCVLPVHLGRDGVAIEPGCIYLAPAGVHMGVTPADARGRRCIALHSGPRINGVRPSADYLFSAMAGSWARGVLSVVLTGMGEDGKNGVAALKQHTNVCLTQAAETCSVYGMPRAVDEAGLSDASLDPVSLTHCIASLCC